MSTLSISVGHELFRFRSKQQWVQKGKDWFADAGVKSPDFICLDARGRVCRYGVQFERAEREGTYPIIVYHCDGEPGEHRAPTADWLVQLRENLRTQDNRITSHPVFVVQQKRRIYGLSTGYSDNIAWVDSEGEADDDKAAELEAQFDEDGTEQDGYTRTAYLDKWEFVTACFTEQGCKDYLAANGHNLHEPRIFVESGYRNAEWQRLREFLASAGCEAAAQGETT